MARGQYVRSSITWQENEKYKKLKTARLYPVQRRGESWMAVSHRLALPRNKARKRLALARTQYFMTHRFQKLTSQSQYFRCPCFSLFSVRKVQWTWSSLGKKAMQNRTKYAGVRSTQTTNVSTKSTNYKVQTLCEIRRKYWVEKFGCIAMYL